MLSCLDVVPCIQLRHLHLQKVGRSSCRVRDPCLALLSACTWSLQETRFPSAKPLSTPTTVSHASVSDASSAYLGQWSLDFGRRIESLPQVDHEMRITHASIFSYLPQPCRSNSVHPSVTSRLAALPLTMASATSSTTISPPASTMRSASARSVAGRSSTRPRPRFKASSAGNCIAATETIPTASTGWAPFAITNLRTVGSGSTART